MQAILQAISVFAVCTRYLDASWRPIEANGNQDAMKIFPPCFNAMALGNINNFEHFIATVAKFVEYLGRGF